MNWAQLKWIDLINPALQFLAIVVAAAIVVWQLGKQHKNSLALQRENAREALKLKIYESLLLRIRALSDACISAKMYAFGIPSAIESFQQEQSRGFQPTPLKQRVPAFSELHFTAHHQLAELLVDFEGWLIAFPGLHVFNVALNAATYDAGQAFTPLFSSLLHILPMDPPSGATDQPAIIHPPPSPEVLAALKCLIEEYVRAMDEMEAYVSDLTIEAQNNLLHGLFEGRVPPRQPLDLRHKVISTVPEKSQPLIRFFETETPWGKNKAAIQAEVKAKVSANSQ